MSRSISSSLAPVLEHLELERPRTVSVADLAEIADEHGVRTPARIIGHRLAQRGWLLKTRVRGVWEFAPAERAGPISEADPFLTLRATLERSDVPVAVALGSALWLHNLVDRAPDRHEIAVPSGAHVPVALRRDYRVVRYEAVLSPILIREVPVHQPATVLVHLAHRPTDIRSWSSVLEALSDLVGSCSEAEIREELAGRPHATYVRLAYLIQGVAPDLIEALAIEPAGKVWFGPRRALRHHDAYWNVADTVLPVSPKEVVRRDWQ